jgi:hypothetical protein
MGDLVEWDVNAMSRWSSGWHLGTSNSPVAPRHIPSLLLISIKERMRANTQLAFRDLALRSLAGSLLAYRLATRRMLCLL